MRSEPILRVLGGAGLSLGLLATGLGLSGNTARALSWTDGAGPSHLEALPGSSSRGSELVIDGVPTRIRTCTASEGATTVLQRYRAIASAESGPVPWAESDLGEGAGMIAWVDEQGISKAVRVVGDAGSSGCSYELLEADSPATARRLPADLPAPAGCRTAFSVLRQDGTGNALLITRDSPSCAAQAVVEALRAQGFAIDGRTAGALEGPPGSPISLPFSAPGRRGLVQVVPAEGGGARISLSIHAG